MRLSVSLLILLSAGGAFAQHGSKSSTTSGAKPSSNPTGNTFTNNGNALHPGTAGTVGVAPAGTFGIGTLIGPGANQAPAQGVRGGNGRGHGRGNVSVAPYGVYGGGGYLIGGNGPVYNPAPGSYDPIFGVYSQESGQFSYPQQQGQTPVVVINQNFQPEVVRPQMIDYTNSVLPPPGPQYSQPPSSAASNDGDTPMILIAMKDHTIYPALAYWVQGDTLNYVMMGGTVNHVSLSQVDRELSAKLNAERRPDFRLP